MLHSLIDSISPALVLVGIGIAGAVFILLLCVWKGWKAKQEQEPLKPCADALRFKVQQERAARIRSFNEKAAKGFERRGGNDGDQAA